MAIDLVAVLRLDDQMTQSMKKVALGATAGFAAITAGVVASVKTFNDFDSEIRKAGAIAEASTADFNALKNAAIDLGASTSKSASEVATSMTELAAAGFEVNDILGAMPGVIAASEASGESLALAAETVGSALSIWSLKAEESTHVADVLAMAANRSRASINDMSYAFKYAGAPAAALKISLEELSAAVGIITNAGIDGSTAGTALRSGLMALSSPLNKQQKIMDKIGFSANHANGETKTLSEMIRGLSASLEGMSDSSKVGVLKDLVGTEAVSAFLSLVSAGADELDEFTNALVKSDGAAATTAKQMMSGIGGAFEELGGFVESAMIRVGDAIDEPLIALAQLATNINLEPLFEVFETLGELAMNVINVIKDNWSTIGPIVTPIIGLLGTFVAVLGLIGGGAAVFAALSAVIGFISGPIALVAAAITLIGAGFVVAYQQFKPFRDAIETGFSKISDFVTTFKQVMEGGLFTGILERDKTAVALAVATATKLKSAFKKVKDFVDTFKQVMSGGMLTGILERDDGAVAKAVAFANGIKTVFGTVKDFISEKITQLQPTFDTLGTIFENLKSAAVIAFTTLWGVAGPILSVLWSALQILGDVIMLVFNNILVPTFKFATTAAKVLWTVMGPILELIGAGIGVAFGVFKFVWDTILSPFLAFLAGGFTVGIEGATKIVEVIGLAFEKVGSFISSAAGYVKDFAKFLSNVEVPDWVGKIGNGAISFANNVFGGGKKDGSHYNGIGRIGWDGYIAELHAGERVLNRFEADQYDAVMGGEMQVAGVSDFSHESSSVSSTTINNTTTNNNGNHAASTQDSTRGIVITGNNFTVREDVDIEKIAYRLAKLIEKEAVYGG